MEKSIFTYEEALYEIGSKSRLNQKVRDGGLFKIERGAYSTVSSPNPLVVAHVVYPDGVVTMDSALFAYGLTDFIPEKVHLATTRGASRIARKGYKQYFLKDELLNPGATIIQLEDGKAKIYDKERLLVEVMRRQASLPFDFYREVITSYRGISHELDIRKIEDYMDLFKRKDFMFDILQREVL